MLARAALFIVVIGCGGVEVERGMEFRHGGVSYLTNDQGHHELYAGASADMIWSVGTVDLGASERFRIDDDGIFSASELILRLRETLSEGEEGPPDEYIEVKVQIVIDTATGRSDICFDVSNGIDLVPFCEPLPWTEAPAELGVSDTWQP